MNFKNIFLISSPLQALTVFILLNNNEVLKNNSIVFVEEGLAEFPNNLCVVEKISSSRNNKKIIRNNCEEIINKTEGHFNLWISDIFWPMNNAFYSYAINSKKLISINFFDEGMVLYWYQKISNNRYIRELLKSTILKFYLGAYTFISKRPFIGLKKVNLIYAYHPDLLKRKNILNIEVKNLDLISYRFQNNIKIKQLIFELDRVNRPVIFLTGPYYRLTSEASFHMCLNALELRLNELGYNKLFIKLHPTESESDYLKYYKKYNFKLLFSDANEPIEAYADVLGKHVDIIGFNSSALLNLKKFGFQGRVISFGLDYISSLSKYDSHLLEIQRKIFESKNVTFEYLWN